MATVNGKSVSVKLEHSICQPKKIAWLKARPLIRKLTPHFHQTVAPFIEKNMTRIASVLLPRLSFSDCSKWVARLAVAMY